MKRSKYKFVQTSMLILARSISIKNLALMYRVWHKEIRKKQANLYNFVKQP